MKNFLTTLAIYICMVGVVQAAPMYYTFTTIDRVAGVYPFTSYSGFEYTFLVDSDRESVITFNDASTLTYGDQIISDSEKIKYQDSFYAELVQGGYIPPHGSLPTSGTFPVSYNIGLRTTVEPAPGALYPDLVDNTESVMLYTGNPVKQVILEQYVSGPSVSVDTSLGSIWYLSEGSFETDPQVDWDMFTAELTNISSIPPSSSPVPVPGALLLFVSGLTGLSTIIRRRKRVLRMP